METSEYIGNIILYVGAAIAALGGSSIGIGAICKWLKKVISSAIEKLTSTKGDYDVETTKLASVAKKVDGAGDKLLQVGSVLESFGDELNAMKAKTDNSNERIEALAQVLSIMVRQNQYMIANGTAKECVKILEGEKDVVSTGVGKNE